jgi:hypothetical protein
MLSYLFRAKHNLEIVQSTASVRLGNNFLPVTNTSVLISLHERNAHHRDRNDHCHRPYRPASNRHSTATSIDKNPAQSSRSRRSSTPLTTTTQTCCTESMSIEAIVDTSDDDETTTQEIMVLLANVMIMIKTGEKLSLSFSRRKRNS